MTGDGPGVVYVVAKAPVPGDAKTRLCPPLQPDQAARLAQAFLLDTLATVRRAGLAARVICRDANDQRALRSPVNGLAEVCVQSGTGLGAALESAFNRGFEDGFASVAVLGADSPTLPPEVLRRAFDVLERQNHVALGPSEDGGYYLLAAQAAHVHLFRQMVWSTDSVAQTTLDRCRASGLRAHLLPTWYDVDDAPSLARLWDEVMSSPHSPAHRTREELRGLATGVHY